MHFITQSQTHLFRCLLLRLRMVWFCWGEGAPAVLRFMKADMKGFGVTEEATSEKCWVLLLSTELDTVTSTSSSFCDRPTAIETKENQK